MSSNGTNPNPMADKPGETSDQARQRATRDINKAAAAGNTAAQRMARDSEVNNPKRRARRRDDD